MPIILKRRGLAAIALLGATAGLIGKSREAVAGNQLAVAISGYDATSYQSGTAQRGLARFNATHNAGIWFFQSEATRDLFKADPVRYAPQFDGYCAWAASQAYKAPGNPEIWRIVDNKLYLQVHEQAQQMWLRDVPGNIAKGNTNWPRIHPF
ncbi:YHS domain-containing (seleno)protein [Falsiroseomonas sp. E2-1-a4]|uniref:YHS domain-containing (seleno)protein n=1 Tax=Falsiroseomonas sp. E2-1-a4 TaxID=3239299 RepID=UPI003F419D7C